MLRFKIAVFALVTPLVSLIVPVASSAQEVTRMKPMSRSSLAAPAPSPSPSPRPATVTAPRSRTTLALPVPPPLPAIVTAPRSRAVSSALRTASDDLTLEGPAAMRLALVQMRRGEWDAALDVAARAGEVGPDIIRWHQLRSGKGDFDLVRDFLTRNPDWPGMDYLRKRTEGLVPYRTRADEVIAHFAEVPPQSGAGMIALAAAYETAGRPQEAIPIVIDAWREMPLTTGDENYLLERYGAILKPHHEARLDARLWDGDAAAAERLIPRVSSGWQKLARARLALRAMADGVDGAIQAVPDELKADPGLAFERFQWRARKGRNDEAIALALSADGTADTLGHPDAWGNWRRIFARSAMRAGDARTAYRLASEHGLSAGSDYADLEWVSGYVALTYLKDPKAALGHFQAFQRAVQTPISLGRAGYWEGRAQEALGDTAGAAAAYAFGARYQTSFYGLLAAERAGLPMDAALVGDADYAPWTAGALAGSRVLRAAILLHAAGEEQLAERFFSHVAEGRPKSEVGQIVDLALSLHDPHIALMVAKRAAEEGVVVPRGYYPLVDLGVKDLPVPEELALSIARRESEFDPVVKSGAGAMGLMQVMPGTAREMAGILNVRYDPSALLSNPAYNARLGSTYLAELVALFGDNYLLVAAGYNAGPSRPIRWMQDRGDPRDRSVDAVDWIEHIPFRETQNYVMRVLESIPVYRARLTGRTGAIRLTDEMKAR